MPHHSPPVFTRAAVLRALLLAAACAPWAARAMAADDGGKLTKADAGRNAAPSAAELASGPDAVPRHPRADNTELASRKAAPKKARAPLRAPFDGDSPDAARPLRPPAKKVVLRGADPV